MSFYGGLDMLSSTTQYALRVLSFMYEKPDALYSVKTLSELLDIPYKYLTKIMTKLSKNNIMVSIQGRNGGFKLSEKSYDLTVEELLMIFKDESYKFCILKNSFCNEEKKCQLHDAYSDSKKTIKNDFLKKKIITIVSPHE